MPDLKTENRKLKILFFALIALFLPVTSITMAASGPEREKDCTYNGFSGYTAGTPRFAEKLAPCIILHPKEAKQDCDHAAFKNITSGTPRYVNKLSSCIERQRLSTQPDASKAVLVHLEQTMRKQANDICRYLDENNEGQKKDDHNNALKEIKRTISFTGCNPLYKTFDDYEQFIFMTNIGYEYAAVDDMLKQGFPRIGFLIYSRLWEADVADSDSGWKLFYGVHPSLTAQMTGSAEQATSKSTFSNNTTVNLGDKRALEFEATAFLPVYRSKKLNMGNSWSYFGPLLLAGGKKVDENPRADIRKYAGGRLAWNPEWYVDLLYGKTEDIDSKRMECRFQVPVSWSPAVKDSRIYFGGIGNFGVGDKRKNEADIIRAYLIWNIDFINIFNDTK